MILEEHLKLLMEREGKVVLGVKAVNLWLLTLVLIATFISIAFSNASLKYLSDKMNDPFTNWVNITNGYGSDKFDDLRENLADPEVQAHYGFGDVQSDNYFSLNMVGVSNQVHYLECRFFERMNSNLMNAILSEENVVNGASIDVNSIDNENIGFIATKDAIVKMGYSLDSIPAFIHYLSYSIGADSLGVKLIDNEFARVPVPLLAVVRRLPMNMDLIAAKFFYSQYNNDLSYPFNMNNAEYQRQMNFFVADEVSDFKDVVAECIPDSLKSTLEILDIDDEAQNKHLLSWKKGKLKSIFVGKYDAAPMPIEQVSAICENIQKRFPPTQVCRIFNYDFRDYNVSNSTYLSLDFHSLDSIRAFEQYAKDNYNVQIEMSQVNSKENFNSVSVMANILSWAMIVFSIICIIIFIVNMLQSYFQKVKRNLGTFKAYGMSTMELIRVYVLILFAIIIAAILISITVAWIIQAILPLLGIMKDGEYNYLSLWNTKTLLAIVIVIIATLLTVVTVMGRLLRQTPGDLIYDRN